MVARYYAHFLTPSEAPLQASEWSGVVELVRPLDERGGTRQVARLLARNFEIETDEIRILHWARLH